MAARKATNKAQQFTQVSDRGIRSNTRRQPIPISSHPEADPELPSPNIALDDHDEVEFRRGPDAERVKPIVSINGNDVEPEEADCDAA